MQYSGRYCLWLHGLKYDQNENHNDIVSKISKFSSEIGFPYKEAVIDKSVK